MMLEWDDLAAIQSRNKPLQVSDSERQAVIKCRVYLENRLDELSTPIYGINTGFGSLCNVVVSDADLSKLQYNLIRSHAAGYGQPVSEHIVLWMLYLKVRSLSAGYSGVQWETVQGLVDLYNRKILPVIPQFGSLGASGDLAPLAHMSLALIGEGQVIFEGKQMPAQDALQAAELPVLTLGAKEGLALLNGTQFMSAHGVEIILKLNRLLLWGDLVASLSLDVFDCRTEPFHPALHRIRPQLGQEETASRIRSIRHNSKLAEQYKNHVQDPYSFRCIPQIHGSTKDAHRFASEIILREVNSVSDNPNVFPDEDLVLSGGNFHGQSIAIALDVLSLGMLHLAGVSERRTYQLQQGLRGLPAFMTPNPGLQSGMMILQYTAVSLINEMKGHAQPNSADSLPSCNGQEDYVSMGGNAAVACLKQAELLTAVLAVEWIHAAQALDLRRPLTTSPVLEILHSDFRRIVPKLTEDRILSTDLQAAIAFIEATDPRPLLSA